MANTYEAIATVTVGSGGAANIEFTSIPATYTDLCLVHSIRTNRAVEIEEGIEIQFNGSTANFSSRRLIGTGSSVASQTIVTREAGIVNAAGSTSSTFGNTQIYIPNYAGSNNKSFSVEGVMENNATASYVDLSAGLWSNTAAITSIKLTGYSSGNFVQYSTATLYGIKNS
jgi:hypothetical protein